MGGERKTYFLCPTRDNLPLGNIALGNIIASPALVELPVSSALPIEHSIMPISRYEETSWKLMLEKQRSGSFGLWGSFLQILGAGGDINFIHEVYDTSMYQFDRLETQTFWPTEEYVKASVTATPVQDLLRRKRYFQNIYMVTSIKIAFGASVAHSVLRNRGVCVQAGVDGTSVGIPLSGGPRGDLTWGEIQSSSLQRDDGFVFAFRLREICYTKRRGLRQKEYVKGAFFGLGSSAIDEKQADSQSGPDDDIDEEFKLMGLAEDEVHADDVGDEAKIVEEEGERCE